MPIRSSGSAFSTKRSHPPASNLPLALVLSPLCRRVCGYFESKFAHPQFRIELRFSRGVVRRGERENSRKNSELYSWPRALSLCLSILSLEKKIESQRGEKCLSFHRSFPNFSPLCTAISFDPSILLLLSVYDRVLPRGSLEWICFIYIASRLVFDRSNVTNPLRRRSREKGGGVYGDVVLFWKSIAYDRGWIRMYGHIG